MLPIRQNLFAIALLLFSLPVFAGDSGAFLEITAKVDTGDRPLAAAVYKKYKQPFLSKIAGAVSKQLLIRKEDVQVLHKFTTVEQAQAYLSSDLFSADVVRELGPLLKSEPEIRVYSIL